MDKDKIKGSTYMYTYFFAKKKEIIIRCKNLIKNFVLNAKPSPDDSRDFVFKSSNENENLNTLVKESQTPKGLNEQGVRELTRAGFYKSLEKTLNSIHKRLNK